MPRKPARPRRPASELTPRQRFEAMAGRIPEGPRRAGLMLADTLARPDPPRIAASPEARTAVNEVRAVLDRVSRDVYEGRVPDDGDLRIMAGAAETLAALVPPLPTPGA